MEEKAPTLLIYIYVTILAFLPFYSVLATIIYCFLLFTPFYLLPLFHYSGLIYDCSTPHSGGRRREWVRRWKLWTIAAQYFPVRLIKTAELDPERNYVCGYHPHGNYATAAITNFGTEATKFSETFPGITPHLVTHSVLFFVPIVKELLTAIGACSSSKWSINHILSKKASGNAVVMAVGGEQKVRYSKKYITKLKIKKRKDIVRFAVKNGADLVPIACFGENEIYATFAEKMARKYSGVVLPPVVYFWEFLIFLMPILPDRKTITTVVGKPIEVVRDENASEEVIDKYHQQYIQSLQQLFDEYKTKVGDEYKDMDIILI